ncbi:MAG TPA: hypothetical protein VK402_01710 [Blastococcus sp.]|nr:hypothetical protein [Blastococcus sp.]
MPKTPPPAEAAPTMPASVRVAVIVMGLLAALLLINAGLLWYAFDAAVDRVVEQGDVSRADARQFVLMSLVPYLVIGLLLAVSAWFFPRRQPWARWTGLTASAVLGLLTLFSMVAAGGVSVGSLLVVVLAAAAVTSLLAPTTTAWAPRLRSRA